MCKVKLLTIISVYKHWDISMMQNTINNWKIWIQAVAVSQQCTYAFSLAFVGSSSWKIEPVFNGVAKVGANENCKCKEFIFCTQQILN